MGMRERLAQRLCAVMREDWDECGASGKQEWCEFIDAILAELQEPTDEMVERGGDEVEAATGIGPVPATNRAARMAFQAMLNAIKDGE